MKLTPPKKSTFVVSLIFAIVGVIAVALFFCTQCGLFAIPCSEYFIHGLWLILVGYILLALGTGVKGF